MNMRKLPDDFYVFIDGDDTYLANSLDVCGCCGAQLSFDDKEAYDEPLGVDFRINTAETYPATNEDCKMTTIPLGNGVFLHLNTLEVSADPPEPDEDEEW